jgi:hypothetical protein
MINTVTVNITCNMRRRRLSITPRITFSSGEYDPLSGWSRVYRTRNSAASAQYAKMATGRIWCQRLSDEEGRSRTYLIGRPWRRDQCQYPVMTPWDSSLSIGEFVRIAVQNTHEISSCYCICGRCYSTARSLGEDGNDILGDRWKSKTQLSETKMYLHKIRRSHYLH